MNIGIDYRLIIVQLLFVLPSVLVILGGLIFAILRFQSHRKISIISIIALLIFLLLRIVNALIPALNMWLIQDGNADMISYVAGTLGTLSSIFGAIALGLLLFAIWSGRKEA